MKQPQQCRKYILLAFGFLLVVSGIIATILALKMDTAPLTDDSIQDGL